MHGSIRDALRDFRHDRLEGRIIVAEIVVWIGIDADIERFDMAGEAERVRSRLRVLPRQPGPRTYHSLPGGLSEREVAILRLVASGWQFSPILKIRSGQPFVVVTGFDDALNGNDPANRRPNQILPNGYASNKSVDGWLNRDAFIRPAPGTIGNMGKWRVHDDSHSPCTAPWTYAG